MRRQARSGCLADLRGCRFVFGGPHSNSDPSPSIPFVTARATDPASVERLVCALREVATAPRWAEVRAGLMLRDIVPIDGASYECLLEYEREAVALGYPVLR